MNRNIIVLAIAISVAGIYSGIQFSRESGDESGGIIATEPTTVKSKNPPVELTTPTPEVYNLMDSSILINAANPALSNSQRFTILWSAYLRNKSSDDVASYYLDSLISISPIPNVDKLIAELNNEMTSPELKRHLMRLLETAFRDRQDSELNGISQLHILDTIKTQITSAQISVAGEAVNIYARQAPSILAVEALANAHEKRIITDAEFIHDIIFKIPNVDDPKKQNVLISQMIQLARSNQSQEVADALVGAVGVLFEFTNNVKLDNRTSSELTNFLIQYEPQFNISERKDYEMITAVNYCNWLNSYAKSGNKSDAETVEFILNTLTRQSTDSKKIVAVLLSDRKQNIVNLARQAGKLELLQNRLKIALVQLSPGAELFNVYQSVLNELN